MLLLIAAPPLLVQLLRPPPTLGPPEPEPTCEVPVERDDGVSCLDRASALHLGLRAGDRVIADGGVARMAPARIEALELSVDINRASPEELGTLPGVGPELAARIAARRPYRNAQDLLRVPGIGEKRLAAIAPRIVVESPR